MKMHPVGSRVSSPENDASDLVLPIDHSVGQTLPLFEPEQSRSGLPNSLIDSARSPSRVREQIRCPVPTVDIDLVLSRQSASQRRFPN